MRKKMVSVVIMCCAVGLASFSGCGKMKGPSAKGKKAEVTAERVKVKVTVGKAERRTMYQERKLLGMLAAYRETDLGPLAPGRVKYLPVKIGDYVKQGQVVAKMDDVQYVSTDAQFQSVKAQYDRSKSLYEANAMPKSQFEGVEAQYTAMKRQMESIGENTVIKAPFSGVVTGKACEEGELYSPMGKGLVHVTQLEPLKIDLDVDDQTVQYIKKGMSVRLTVDQTQDSGEITGRVEYVNPQGNDMSRTFGTRLIVQNRGRTLRPGYFAEVHIILGEKKGALTVPRQAIVDDRVFVLKGAVALAKKVTVGWLTDDYAEILSGVDENAEVVLSGNKALPDSAQVDVVGRKDGDR
jgi:membrane fusion protein (multidrug efflux system)